MEPPVSSLASYRDIMLTTMYSLAVRGPLRTGSARLTRWSYPQRSAPGGARALDFPRPSARLRLGPTLAARLPSGLGVADDPVLTCLERWLGVRQGWSRPGYSGRARLAAAAGR